MVSNDIDINESLDNTEGVLDAVSGALGGANAAIINKVNVVNQLKTELGIVVDEADLKVDIATENALSNALDKMEEETEIDLDDTTLKANEVVGNIEDVMDSSLGVRNQIQALQSTALGVGNKAVDMLETTNKGLDTAQDLVRKGFDELMVELKDVSLKYAKAKLVGAAEQELAAQIAVVKRIITLVDTVKNSKEIAISTWANTKNNLTVAKKTAVRFQELLVSSQEKLKVLVNALT